MKFRPDTTYYPLACQHGVRDEALERGTLLTTVIIMLAAQYAIIGKAGHPHQGSAAHIK